NHQLHSFPTRRSSDLRTECIVAKEPKSAATTPEGAAPAKPAAKRKKEFKKKRERRVVPHGLVYVAASFNNTQITITDLDGRTMRSEEHTSELQSPCNL